MRYEPSRRPGFRHRFTRFDGQLVDAETDSPPIYTSWPLAAVFAGLLNREELSRATISDPSPIPRYSVSAAPNKQGEFFIYGATSPTVRDEAQFGFGVIAKTGDTDVAKRLVERMNAIDPAPRSKVWLGGF